MIARLPVGRRLIASLVALAAGTGLVVALATPGAMGAYSARITNSTNTTSTAQYFTCQAAAVGDGALLDYKLDDTGPPVMADSSGGARNGSFTLVGITYRQPGPCIRDGGFAITLNGSTGYASGPATTYNPSTFSEEIWFKTTTGGGKLMGFGNALTGQSTAYDRHVYLTNAGNVVFGVYPGAVKTIQSPSTYLDGKWHHVVATQGLATNANPGIRLYLDGALVASDSTVVSNEGLAEYWRIGYDNLANWGATQPTNFFFTGGLDAAAMYPTVALTPAQVRSHFIAGQT